MIEAADTRDPPTFRTMSANTVVVVTTLSALAAGVAAAAPSGAARPDAPGSGEPVPARHAARSRAATARTTTPDLGMRPSLRSRRRVIVSMVAADLRESRVVRT